MNIESRTASDREMNNRVGMTAAGLASATQLVDVAPFMTVRIDQTAVLHPLLILARESEGRPEAEPARKMIDRDDPEDMLASSLEDLEDWEAQHGGGQGDAS